MRRVGAILITAVAMMGAGPATQPATTKPARSGPRTIHAMVAGVEAHVLRISMLRKQALLKERRIRVARDAVITFNQKPVTLLALKAGENVMIQLSHGFATRIDATGT